jgi:DNA-binding transcriptional MocR family regulator
VPGYDRHFAICERLGIEMINIPMDSNGPDMDAVEAAVKDDPSVKGIWCVPKYSNPSGVTYSDSVTERLAAMPVAADEFRVIWDNAYAAHHLGGGPATVKNLLQACKDAGNPDRVLMFGSTSKMTLAGAGVAMMAASKTNIDDAKAKVFFSTIGPDKINQLRHVRFSAIWTVWLPTWINTRPSSRPSSRPLTRLWNAASGAKGSLPGQSPTAAISSVSMSWTVAPLKWCAWPVRPA